MPDSISHPPALEGRTLLDEMNHRIKDELASVINLVSIKAVALAQFGPPPGPPPMLAGPPPGPVAGGPPPGLAGDPGLPSRGAGGPPRDLTGVTIWTVQLGLTQLARQATFEP